jgi:tRNA threonylcarbamoyladenosine biosynthesis protein TsaE
MNNDLEYRNFSFILNLDQIDKFAELLSKNLEICDVILLNGDLGAGKTTLVKNICNYINKDEYVSSPSFGLYNIYDLRGVSIWHYDLYRLGENVSTDELLNLDFDEAISNNITIVEWAERLGGFDFNRYVIQIDIKYFENRMDERLYEIKFLKSSKWSKVLLS